MPETRIRIQTDIEKSTTIGSILITNTSNELQYLAPSSNGTVLSIVGGVPVFTDVSVATNYWTLSSGRLFRNSNIGIGASTDVSKGVFYNKNIEGATTSSAFEIVSNVQSEVTTTSYGYWSRIGTQASAFTLNNLVHFSAQQLPLGVGSAITNQIGFNAEPNMINGNVNIGFRSLIPSGTSNWGFYNSGTANNYFNGRTIFGSSTTDDTTSTIQVVGAIKQSSVVSALLKTNASGVLVAAIAGTDYLTSSNGIITFSGGTTGLLPSTATTGAITLSGTLKAVNGGTGQSTYAVGDLLQGGATNTLTKLTAVATGNVLISGGVGVASSWGKVGLTTHITGTLPVANGGTGATTLTGTLVGNGTGVVTAIVGTASQLYRRNAANTAYEFFTINTSLVPENTNLYYTNLRGIGSTLTDYVSGTGVISASDTILSAIQKLNGNVTAITANSINYWTLSGSNVFRNSNVGIGSFASSGSQLSINKNITGSATSYGIYNTSVIQSDVTNLAAIFQSTVTTQATSFTTNITHFRVYQNAFGAGSTVNAQIGYDVDSTMSGGGTNFGFRSSIPVGSSNWNLYMVGGAKNHLQGTTLIGSIVDTTLAKLQVTGAIQQTSVTNALLKTNGNGVLVPAVNYTDYLGNLAVLTPVLNNVISFNGTNWINKPLTLSDINDYTISNVNYWTRTGSDLSYVAGDVLMGSTTKAQARFYGWASHATDQSTANGEILIGSAPSFQGRIGYDGQNSATLRFTNSYTSGGIDFYVGATNNSVKFLSNGRVLMGASSDDTINRLQVNGSAIIDTIRIDKTGAASNVFVISGGGHTSATGSGMTGLGYQSLFNLTNGNENTGVGIYAGASITTGSGNVAVGRGSLFNGSANFTGSYCIALGHNAMNASRSEGYAIMIGVEAGKYSVNQVTAVNTYNIGIGYQALRGEVATANVTGGHNIGLGYQVGLNLTSGGSNILLGQSAGLLHKTGVGIIAIGANALGNSVSTNYAIAIGIDSQRYQANTTSSFNTSVGFNSLAGTIGNSTGVNNNAFGAYSLQLLTTANNNCAFGHYSGNTTTTGGNNVFSGAYSGRYANGSQNVYLGYNAGQGSLGTNTGSLNNAIGSGSLVAITTGQYNTVLGHAAGNAVTTGTGNIFIGGLAGVGNVITGSYNVCIGYNMKPSTDASNVFILGTGGTEKFSVTSAGRFNIGYPHSDALAQQKLQVNGGGYFNGDVYATQNVTSYSDKRLKSNIEILKVGDKIEKLQLYTYIKNNKKDIGLIAQEVQKVFPLLVTKGEKYLGISHLGMTAVAIQSSKENYQKIKNLEKRIEELEKLLIHR